MKNKTILKSCLSSKDIETLRQIEIDLGLYQPVWKMLGRMFGHFDIQEWASVRADILILIRSQEMNYQPVNLSYLHSLSTSFELLSSRFTLDMLETYGKLYQTLVDDGLAIQRMYEELSDQLECEP